MFNSGLYQEKYRIKSTRLPNWDYSNQGYYFVTTCVKYRKCVFGEIVNDKMVLNKNGYIIKQCWYNLPNHYDNCKLDAFIIMPNHIHGIIQIKGYKYKSVKTIHENKSCNIFNVETIHPNQQYIVSNVETIHESSLRGKIKYRRQMLLSKIIGRFKMQTSKMINLNNSNINFQWQKSYYDHIVRNENDLDRIRNYIQNNPLNWNKDRNNI